MTTKEAPNPAVYLTAKSPVTSLAFFQTETSTQDFLLVGSSVGTLSIYDCSIWRLKCSIKVSEKGILWCEGSKDNIFVQSRFEGLKVYQFSPKNENDACLELAQFYISHEGFCKGFIHEDSGNIHLFLPSDGSKLTICNFKQKFIRPVHSLNAESKFKNKKFGTLMASKILRENEVITGYENSEIILWNWRKNEVLTTFPVPECGTIMSIATSLNNGPFVIVAGAENKIVVLKYDENHFTVIKEHEITNAGIGVLGLRPDVPILTCGGWDHRIRLFSFKYPEKLKPLAVLDFHSEAVESMAFSKRPLRTGICRGKTCTAAGSKDGKISIWTLYS
eukprot:TRINITY_DN1319_c0_g1_i10.p1 TRINITY_DN1319_c0_g1~~TRINITY_DN1319_c0_g1_i10.p1  ORF type:complete len:334 (-),score=12.98 TRINITY_DN1319_c0_g1_i10:135-1136(-)